MTQSEKDKINDIRAKYLSGISPSDIQTEYADEFSYQMIYGICRGRFYYDKNYNPNPVKPRIDLQTALALRQSGKSYSEIADTMAKICGYRHDESAFSKALKKATSNRKNK